MMAYFKRLVLLGLASSTLALAGCDKGSLGEYGETEGDSDSESETGTPTSTTGGVSDSGSSATSTTGTSSTGSPTSTTTTDGSTGSAGICDYSPNHDCAEPVECTDSFCGGTRPNSDDRLSASAQLILSP